MTDLFAVRNGDIGHAMGDVFGSSMAKMLILAVADLSVIQRRLLTKVAVNPLLVGAIAMSLTNIIAGVLTSVEPSVTASGMFAILLLMLTRIEILHEAERHIWLIEPDALLRLVVYAGGLMLVYRVGG